MKTEKRYFVDRRIGCTAVRDKKETDPDYPGLHEYTKGVVKYWPGVLKKTRCKECGADRRKGWEVNNNDIVAAEKLCKVLNLKKTVKEEKS